MFVSDITIRPDETGLMCFKVNKMADVSGTTNRAKVRPGPVVPPGRNRVNLMIYVCCLNVILIFLCFIVLSVT